MVSSTTVVWDTLDSNSRSQGLVTAKQATNGAHAKVYARAATVSSSNPIVYRWTSTETSRVAEAGIDAGGTTGEWEDKTAETTTNTKKVARARWDR